MPPRPENREAIVDSLAESRVPRHIPGVTPAELDATTREMRPLLVRWAASVVPGPAAEDVAQEALVALHRRRDDVPVERAAAWLREAVRRIALHTYRGREVPVEELDAVDPAPSPEVTLASAQLSEAVREALARVPASRREVVVEVLGEGASVAEVARERGIPESTVRSRLAADVEALRDDLHRQRVSEKRRGGSTSWCVAVLGLTDVRAALRRIALLAATTTGGALLILPAGPRLGPTAIDAPSRAVMVDTVRPVTALPAAERSVGRPEPVARLRARHDVAARMLAERLRRPE
jgi:RNA polymerase sigma-70 factor (ECF subfamily)